MKAITKRARQILAIVANAPASPPKLNTPAMTARIKNKSVQDNMTKFLSVCVLVELVSVCVQFVCRRQSFLLQ